MPTRTSATGWLKSASVTVPAMVPGSWAAAGAGAMPASAAAAPRAQDAATARRAAVNLFRSMVRFPPSHACVIVGRQRPGRADEWWPDARALRCVRQRTADVGRSGDEGRCGGVGDGVRLRDDAHGER